MTQDNINEIVGTLVEDLLIPPNCQYWDCVRDSYKNGKYEYCYITWKTCPQCKQHWNCALTNLRPRYKCTNCGYEGQFLNYPSGLAEYRGEVWKTPLFPTNDEVKGE